MRKILLPFFMDLVLVPVFWLAGETARVPLFLMLAVVNVMYYLLVLMRFFREMPQDENRRGYTLQFVLIQFFIIVALFLFKVVDMIILFHAR